jgi:uncharacterized membrane protein
LYYANVTLHVLAAMFWLGGMLFLGIVAAPLLRAVEPEDLRQQLFRRIGQRFRTFGWAAIAILVITGTINLYYRGLLQSGVLMNAAFWRTAVGTALLIKLVAVTAMLVVSVMHDFVIGPRAALASAGSSHALTLRKRAVLLARLNALFGILVVIAAVRVARGG